MAKLMSRERKSVIAIDVGTCSVRALQLREVRGKWRVHHWLNLETEPTSPEGPGLDRARLPEQAFGEGTFFGRRAALLVGPPEVEYKHLELPAAILAASGTGLRTALQFELDRQLPWPVGESELAAWSIEPEAQEKCSAMVAAARTESVQHRIDLLDERGLDCVTAEILPNVVIAACAPSAAGDAAAKSEPLWGILDVGFGSARLYLIHGDRPVYARILRGGGRELTETLAEAMHVDFSIAEQYKRIYGIRETDRGFRTALGGLAKIDEEALPGVLYAILRETLEKMAHDAERACRFALGQFPGVSVGPVFLTGGGARLAGLADVLSKRLGVPVRLPDPGVALGVTPDEPTAEPHPACSPSQYPAMIGCVGLALKEAMR